MIIWLASYPKSGNTWLRLFLRAYFLSNEKEFSINYEGEHEYEAKTFPNIDLLKNNRINYYEFEQIVKNWIKLQDYVNLNNRINLLKTHNGNFNINGFPFTNSENTVGGIYIVRDPRDVALSYANHFNLGHEEVVLNMNNMQNYEFYDKDLNKGFKISIMGTWASNYNSWRYYQGRSIHLVKYENMINNPEEVFYKVLKYLNSFMSFEIDKISSDFDYYWFDQTIANFSWLHHICRDKKKSLSSTNHLVLRSKPKLNLVPELQCISTRDRSDRPT